MTSPITWFSGIMLVGVIVFLVIFFSVQGSRSPDPGIAWKIPYKHFPELQVIYDAFCKSCEIPNIPEQYFSDIKSNVIYQDMREACKTLPDHERWSNYELNNRTLTWGEAVRPFLDTTPGSPYHPLPSDEQKSKGEDSEYYVRLGCFGRNIPSSVEQVATQQIQALMKRLGLPNKLNRLTDSRGTTYMPPGGFMEYHSNQAHYAGWRLYMHYLIPPKVVSSDQESAVSWFAYEHPFDGSYRRLQDTNTEANMFRIRKPPKKLLWHCIYSDTHRFSWGIWLPPELAQHLKAFGRRA